MSLLMPSRRACLRALTAAFLCLGGTALMAQSTGAIAGMISDTTGGAIPGASIMATNQATGLKWSTISGGSGDYQIVALPTGPYQLEVQAPGFQTQVIKNLPVAVAQTTAQNIQLTVGQISETLTVDAAAPVVQTATMATSGPSRRSRSMGATSSISDCSCRVRSCSPRTDSSRPPYAVRALSPSTRPETARTPSTS